ncbi:hypothetical protein RI570_11210 [Brucella pseudogrignonensis]|uniref:hypothetical protein n=1 Tax=Brucella pseudogrignonensis TaxID=419475 RepID=UPI0028B39066|nr:hypothetical protein [Brucella pseudogrignonensis]MDT6940715.1 hypothetical protein [Brucella pseudogrignonensis]
MNEQEVRALFIHAAFVDNRLPETGRPARLKAQALPYFHTQQEKAGWIPADYVNGEPIPGKTAQERRRLKRLANDKLEFNDRGRLGEEADRFWSGRSTRLQAEDLSIWEKANDLIRLVTRERNRRCLWAYAMSQAKALKVSSVNASGELRWLRMSFSKWCATVEGVHRNYGKVCADTAIVEISGKLASNGAQPNEKARNCTLRLTPEIGDIRDKMEASASRDYNTFTTDGWAVKDRKVALQRFDEKLIYVDMSDLRNRRRRKQYLDKAKAA